MFNIFLYWNSKNTAGTFHTFWLYELGIFIFSFLDDKTALASYPALQQGHGRV